ncbi:MAG: hypothetical protein K2Y02_09980, partial [Burkholderiaceae bacterium]|nr:hypothetical protein [Burkholderiaceae bacterium]
MFTSRCLATDKKARRSLRMGGPGEDPWLDVLTPTQCEEISIRHGVSDTMNSLIEEGLTARP